jgi:2-oxoglutarate dehydrogenase E2 component (dihydrolipoamide succinyltransferase)
MAAEVKVPPVGESISTGILAVWHVKEGDRVERDQLLFELETDKITSEGLAEVSGIISIKTEEGEEVDIGQVVAVIEESEVDDEGKAEESEPTSTAKTEAQPEVQEDAPVSPAVRRIAAETGVDPASVEGSGKKGRVTKGDMLEATANSDEKQEMPAAAPTQNVERTSRKKMTGLRSKIADRLVQAQQEAAILTTFNEVDMNAVMRLRKQHQEKFVAKYGHKLGFMSFFVKAVVNALKEVPGVNAQIDGNEIVTNHYYDIGIAVGTEKGLVVPVVRDCDQKSFSGIEGDIIQYAGKAREGKLAIDDLQGGVFTITNGGIYGSMLSTPILNRPQSGILGMHSIQERPMAVNGEVVIRPMMYLALSYDHRLVDGKEAVTFLVKVKEAIEDPTTLLFEI